MSARIGPRRQFRLTSEPFRADERDRLMFEAFSGRKLFSFLSRTIALLGNLAGHQAMGEEVGNRLEEHIEVGVEVPELEHLDIAAPEHLVDVAHCDTAGGKRCPDAFASRIASLPGCGSSE